MNLSFSKRIQVPTTRLISIAGSLVLLTFAAAVPAQTVDKRGKNNPYSPSPAGKAKQGATSTAPPSPSAVRSGPLEVAFVMQSQNTPDPEDRPTIVQERPAVAQDRPTVAQRTFKIAKIAETRSMPPTESYKVGVGDVLFVNLKNAAQASGYYTVRKNGTIDFPLAGDNVIVADQTIEDIEGMLQSGITLFPDPQVEVKVRQYGSHAINVSGMVENAGEKNLQREAIPLYVIRAEAIVDPVATKAVITRAPLLKTETYDLRDANTDNVLIYAGNSVEFKSDSLKGSNAGFYYISGEVLTSGQKELTAGLTLYQSIAASGGTKGEPKRAVIRRKNEKGLLANTDYNLRSIRDGKSIDPALSPGDVIEIRN